MSVILSTLAGPMVPRAGMLAALVALTVACGIQPAPNASPTPTEIPTVAPLPSLDFVLSGIVTPTPTPTPTATPVPDGASAVPEYYDARTNMFRIFSKSGHPLKVALEGVQRARANKDPSQVPIILEVMRFFTSARFQEEAEATLRALTGQPPEGTQWVWQEWMEWFGANSSEYRPPEGYAEWKSVLLGMIDERYKDFFPPGEKTANIDLTELIWGGIAPEGNPDLQSPEHIVADKADYMLPDDRVFGVSINGEHRAYPLRIMISHEIANDVLGGQDIVVTYCALCGAGIVYKAEVEGSPATFGTSGLIYRSNSVLYDRVANSLWLQYTGEPIIGAVANPGVSLERVPVVLTTWQEWVERHPDTTVLSGSTRFSGPEGYVPESAPGSLLREYERFENTIFPVWTRSDALRVKEMVLGVGIDGDRKAYPVPALQQARVLNDAVGGTEIVVVASSRSQAARVYRSSGREFAFRKGESESVGTPKELVDADGARWRMTEEQLVNIEDPSQTLARLATHMSYWFAWYAFYPGTELYTQDGR